MNTTKSPAKWTCDSCGQVIKTANEGTLEWQRDKKGFEFGFRIVHLHPSSPRIDRNKSLDGQKGCSFYLHSDHVSPNVDLTSLVGPDGLVRLLSFLCRGLLVDVEVPAKKLRDPGEIVEVIRRLHIPNYEEAKPHLFPSDSWPNGLAGYAALTQEVLLNILTQEKSNAQG